MKILVTGAAGFIGSHLVDQLCREGFDIIGLDDMSNGSMANLSHAQDGWNFQFVRHDLKQPLDLNLPRIDVIVHLAACGSVPRSLQEPQFFVENNVMGFQNVLEFARRNTVKTVFYASSSSVYGDSTKFYRHESDPTIPRSPYAATKLMNEVMAAAYARAYGIECFGLRFFNVFGPRQKLDSPYAAVLPKFCKGALDGRRIEIFGDGKQIRSLTPVAFVVESLCRMIAIRDKIRSSVFNVTSADYAISVHDLASLVIRILGEEVTVSTLPTRHGDVKTSIGDGGLLEDLLGEKLSDQYPQLEAITEVCAWYKSKLIQQ